MARMTRRTWGANGEVLAGGGATRVLGGGGLLLPAVLISFLFACGALSASAWAETTKAPAVTKQPLAKTVEEGQSAVFESAASGVPTPTVQWELSTNGGGTWSAVEGATSDKLTIASASASESADQFRAVFKNAVGEATSKAATLTVRAAPVVILQPTDEVVEEGRSAEFEAVAVGAPEPTVQWERSVNGGSTWAVLGGATSQELTIAATKASESAYEYRATFKNVAGKAISETATLTVRKAPSVTKQPLDTTVDEGDSAVFEATASGFPAPTVQWQVSTNASSTWSAVEGGTSDRLTITSASGAESGDQYRAVFDNAAGEATSTAATLTVHAPPLVTEQPAGMTVEVGQSAVFEATASGFPTPTVQWESSTNGGGAWSTVEGATSDQLTVTNAQASESGDEYRAVFTNPAGQATTAAATLTVATTHYSAVAWGQNLYRQLGDGGSEADSDVPVPVSGLKFVTAVAAGGRHSLALLANGTVVAWGENEFGQLGDESFATSSVPVAVSGLTGVKAIAAGANHSLALLSNGTVMAWGDGEFGQLGDGATKESEVPVPVKGLTNVKAIAAGGEHSLALMSNGTVMAWGDNESGQLGSGDAKSSSVPVAVKGLSGATAVAAGAEFSLALLGKGTVEGWGSDESGQLGNSSVEEGSSEVPVPVGSLTGVTAIVAGSEHGLALLGNGTVMAWGQDSDGELGNGTIKASEETPVSVTGLSSVAAISAGTQDSAALLSQGSVMAWGVNRWGALGDGVAGGSSDVPVAVSGVDKVASISAGGAHMLAFGEPIPTVVSVSPNTGPTAGENTVTISGDDLTEVTGVKFGPNAAIRYTVESPTSVTAVVPAGSGTVDVTVSTSAGTSPTRPADRYTYQKPPTVTKLSAKSGPAQGETSVTITGTEFSGASKVSFGTSSAAFTVNSPTSITAVSPAGAAGVVDITVTNLGGTSAASIKDHFTYTPTVESVTPNGGSTAGHTNVTVTGSGFALGSAATTFKFAAKKAASVDCTSSTSCTVTAPPAAAGTVNVTAQVNKVTSPVSAPGDEFTYS